ncbi:PAS domain-containing protein [Nostocaceae cyanobacterium CENA369]|uniref:PAS domain-containing protein n=1 Tax=Dendronalium phyllosphericum CENA369 TaxID=1725256 RepID=A0A8J7LE51_9NOST|nr:PAS domain-containing protein [Dendronalium phyllosphericum CENA369]
MQRAARTNQEVTDEMELVFEDGTVRFIYGKATPLRNEAGDVRGVIAAFVDMTVRCGGSLRCSNWRAGEQRSRERKIYCFLRISVLRNIVTLCTYSSCWRF